MGILNVTPDSFSDGGLHLDPFLAADRALLMKQQGASIIDIGGESTRPGAQPITIDEELRRILPVIEKIREQSDSIFISIDTTKAEVARQAIEMGADIINDISAGEKDPKMFSVIAKSGAGLVLMHMKGSPETMQVQPQYQEVVPEIASYLHQRCASAQKAGIAQNQLVIDPGIGFGKTVPHNMDLLRHLSILTQSSIPVLVGASRKSFLGALLQRPDPTERLAGNLGVAAWAIQQGVHLLRVHDVIDTCDLCTLLDTLSLGEN